MTEQEHIGSVAMGDSTQCETCNGRGEVGGHRGQTAESYEEYSEPCPSCTTNGFLHALASRLRRIPVSMGVDGHDIDRLLALSRPVQEPVAIPDGPFHVSRSSDGQRHWFSARDDASGVTVPLDTRERAAALVESLNRTFALHLRLASPQPAHGTSVTAGQGVEAALQRALDFIESLTADPLLLADDIEMNLSDVQSHARIELASIRKALATPTPKEESK